MAELHRESPLFDKVLVVQLQSGIQEARYIPLTLRIIPGNRSTSLAGQAERLVHFEVTDENDPYFLYILDVGEQDFHQLKRDQSLLVEFPVFPTKLIDLIELCLISSGDTGSTSAAFESTRQASSSTFSAKIDMTSGAFSIIESNKFNQLTHIALQMRPGNDAAIKAYLSSRLAHVSGTASKKSEDLEKALTDLETLRAANRELIAELTELRRHRDVDAQTLRSIHAQEVSQYRLDHIAAMEQERQRHDGEASVLRGQLEAMRGELQNTREALEQQVSELVGERNDLDFQVRELTRQLEARDQDKHRLSEETAEAVGARRALEEERTSLSKDVARLEAKLEAAVQQVRDRDESVTKTEALQEASEEARAAAEEKLAMYMANIELLQEKLRVGGSVVVKGNEIIAKLQADGKQLKEKMRIKGEVIKQQEALVVDLRSRVAELERDLTARQDNTATKDHEIEWLQKQLEDTRAKLTESTKLVASNQEVIAYLNEEINRWQLGVRVNADVDVLSGTAGQYGTYAHTPKNTYSSPYTASGVSATTKKYTDSSPFSPNTTAASHTPGTTATASRQYSYNTSADLKDSFTTKSFHHQQQQRSSQGQQGQRQGNHTSTNNTTGTGTGTGTEGKEVYMRGLQNLGLTDMFVGLDDLGLDLSFGRENNNTQSGRRATGTAAGTASTATAGVDLESLDYYSTGSAPPSRATGAPGNSNNRDRGSPQIQSHTQTSSGLTAVRGSAASKNKLYSWQADDFGLQ